jgi:hypothetical protein
MSERKHLMDHIGPDESRFETGNDPIAIGDVVMLPHDERLMVVTDRGPNEVTVFWFCESGEPYMACFRPEVLVLRARRKDRRPTP